MTDVILSTRAVEKTFGRTYGCPDGLDCAN